MGQKASRSDWEIKLEWMKKDEGVSHVLRIRGLIHV